MELSKNYTPQEAEPRWYKHWTDRQYFHSTPRPDAPAYTVVIPPPNVTGVLHMGHALNNSVQDVLIRHARLRGYNTCWVPGTDHASIATEAKVAAMLREQGIDKNSLSRAEFLQHAWAWKEKYGGIILQQLRKLGCALDWDRTAFTMDPDYYEAVIDVFIDLHRKGHIYRGVKMINWDPKAKTALSDEEVIHKEVQSKLVYVRYPLESDASRCMTVATVRPETILGDVAICVHPEDERYKDLVGQYCFVPLINRRIAIIADEYIDREFGTGCLKVTPAHDINDYTIGLKHNLPVIDTLNEDGTLSEAAQLYVGMDRFEVRTKIVEDLQAAGLIEKVEAYTNQVGFSERTDVVIEPRLSMQWWCRMESLAAPALEVVMNDEIKFYPPKFKNTYRHWMANIKDWCISRQLRWGHRIPAWYDKEGHVVIAKNEAEAQAEYARQFPDRGATDLQQDSDVLDTWFSSWLWPLEVFGWNRNKDHNAELEYYYPTATLVTAPEIIFFWVARMIMAGLEYRKQIPFKQVYFTGIVRDKQGRKMSKSLGNSPDLLELIDQYGADAVRFGVLIASPAGNDLLFDESGLEQGKMFTNKIWNALKLLQLLKDRPVETDNSAAALFPNHWFAARLDEVKNDVEQDIREFRLSEALKKIYSLIWDDFCSWYLEWIKTPQDMPMNAQHLQQASLFFEELMKLLHPFMPFLTEEIYHLLAERAEGDDLCIATLSPGATPDAALLEKGNTLKALITSVRDARVRQQIKPKDPIELFLPEAQQAELQDLEHVLRRQCFAKSIQYASDAVSGAIAFRVDKLQCFFITEQAVDTGRQREQLLKEKEYLLGFLNSVEKKLGNERFVQNAKPEVVALEQKKRDDTLEKLKIVEENLTLL
jgi:valyl-tRNA synthetase